MRGFWFISIMCALVIGEATSTACAEEPLPAWIIKSADVLRSSRSHDVIEEATYESKRAFEFISGDRFDTGEEHALVGEDGKKICQFGGFVGHVTSGSCDIGKIVYVRTIYSGTHRQ